VRPEFCFPALLALARRRFTMTDRRRRGELAAGHQLVGHHHEWDPLDPLSLLG
jgi:hypothetical protein